MDGNNVNSTNLPWSIGNLQQNSNAQEQNYKYSLNSWTLPQHYSNYGMFNSTQPTETLQNKFNASVPFPSTSNVVNYSQIKPPDYESCSPLLNVISNTNSNYAPNVSYYPISEWETLSQKLFGNKESKNMAETFHKEETVLHNSIMKTGNNNVKCSNPLSQWTYGTDIVAKSSFNNLQEPSNSQLCTNLRNCGNDISGSTINNPKSQDLFSTVATNLNSFLNLKDICDSNQLRTALSMANGKRPTDSDATFQESATLNQEKVLFGNGTMAGSTSNKTVQCNGNINPDINWVQLARMLSNVEQDSKKLVNSEMNFNANHNSSTNAEPVPRWSSTIENTNYSHQMPTYVCPSNLPFNNTRRFYRESNPAESVIFHSDLFKSDDKPVEVIETNVQEQVYEINSCSIPFISDAPTLPSTLEEHKFLVSGVAENFNQNRSSKQGAISKSSPKKSDDRSSKEKRRNESKFETDAETLRRRQKQIEYGKNTAEYKRYMDSIPKEKRRSRELRTPDKFLKCSRRSWDSQIKIWRKKLHDYDP